MNTFSVCKAFWLQFLFPITLLKVGCGLSMPYLFELGSLGLSQGSFPLSHFSPVFHGLHGMAVSMEK